MSDCGVMWEQSSRKTGHGVQVMEGEGSHGGRSEGERWARRSPTTVQDYLAADAVARAGLAEEIGAAGITAGDGSKGGQGHQNQPAKEKVLHLIT